MADTLTPAGRSERMSRIRGKNSKPEMLVRRIVHGMGYRYRLHDKRLPGSPDLVFRGRKKVIFVHGCFWHRHEGCRKAGPAPKTRTAFWQAKFDRNKARDARNADTLREAGWNVATIWECETRDPEKLTDQLRSIFNLPDRVAGNDP